MIIDNTFNKTSCDKHRQLVYIQNLYDYNELFV